MPTVEEAVTALYRNDDLAGLAFALTGSVEGAAALMRVAAPRAVARGWRLAASRESRMRDALVAAACAKWRSGPAVEPEASPSSSYAPPAPGPAPRLAPQEVLVAITPAGNPYAPPSSATPHAAPAPVPPATVPPAPTEATREASPFAPPLEGGPAVTARVDTHTLREPQTEAAADEPTPLSEADLAIAALPDDIRLAMALHYRADLETRGIARAMRIGRDDVIEMLALGRMRLAAVLGTSEQDVERLVVAGTD